MTFWRATVRIAALAAVPFYAAFAAAPAPPAALTGFPFTNEDLSYSINWPSGINLGEAQMHARRSGTGWIFQLTLNAAVPGFQVKDTYRSEAVPDFCSISFDRTIAHGSRTAQEQENIDRERATATRTSLKGGGTSELPVPVCVKDALTYLFYARREMGQGRVPAPQQILMGGLYQIRVDYAGAQTIPVNGKQVQTDKVVCTVKGPSSESAFEMYFARDPARTPLLMKVPLAMGAFSMQLLSPELIH